MSTYANFDMSLLVGDFEVACRAKSATFNAECAALDTLALCSTDGWQTLIAGRRSWTYSAELMSDMEALGLDETLFGQLATAGIPQSLSIGSADGSLTYFSRAMSTQYVPMSGQPGELAMASLSGVGSTGPLIRGLRIHPPSAVRSATGNGAAYQLGALSSTQTLYVALHVLERTGTASMTLKVQSDNGSGFASPTDQITTFTAATARGYQWGTKAGAVTDDYWRCVYTISGTGTIRFAVSAGIAAAV